jgi:hypothetical protein
MLLLRRAPLALLIAAPWLEVGEQVVVVRNASNRDLILKDPTFDCSCFYLTKGLGSVRLPPGGSTSITLGIASTKTSPGRFHKTMTFLCDDPRQPKVDVPLVGEIADFRQVSPRDLALGDVEIAGPAVAKTVEVRGGSGSTVKVVDVATDDPSLAAVVKPVPDGSDIEVRTTDKLRKGSLGAVVRMTIEVRGTDGVVRRYPDAVAVRATVK